MAATPSSRSRKTVPPLIESKMAKFGGDDIDAVIMDGITFKGGSKGGPKKEEATVKTKAKKKQYITGAHGSGAAKKKADIRRQRANRHK